MSQFAAYPHLAARLFNVALLVHPQKLDAIIAGLGQRLLGSQIANVAEQGGALPPELFTTRKGPRAERGYQVVDGVAVLNVSGALVHKTRMEADSSTLLGYNSIYADLQDAMDNPDVHAVLQVWDSPGGEAQGAFQYADQALALRGKKPFIALADGMAASAGYLGASAADQLAITSTGYAGSIGVVMRHVDVSAALMNEGVRVSHIYAGAKKIDGNSFEPLSATVRADFQAEIDSLYATFIDTVARARNMSPAAIRATQAATYRGQAAVTAGLADRISTA
jgi:signal peptide peptidase SppA